MELHSFIDEISIMQNAKYIVASCTSGITNIIFMKDRGYVLEWRPEDAPAYPLFSAAAGPPVIDYNFLFCKMEKTEGHWQFEEIEACSKFY